MNSFTDNIQDRNSCCSETEYMLPFHTPTVAKALGTVDIIVQCIKNGLFYSEFQKGVKMSSLTKSI